MGFGKHSERTVQELLNAKQKWYLIWIYYNMSMITFMDDILEEVFIYEEYRIEKPGKDVEKWEQAERVGNAVMLRTNPKFIKERSSFKKRNRIKVKNNEKANKLSKSQLQSKNHGR